MNTLTHPSMTHSNVEQSIGFLYRYIVEQCPAFNIRHKKIDMVSPTYIVDQCLEKQPELYL